MAEIVIALGMAVLLVFIFICQFRNTKNKMTRSIDLPPDVSNSFRRIREQNRLNMLRRSSRSLILVETNPGLEALQYIILISQALPALRRNRERETEETY